MTTLLILTAGRTDVQLVRDGRRHELPKGRCGELLEQIVRRGYTLCDTPARTEAEDSIESLLPGDELRVCTPKLDQILRYFENGLPEAAIIFETRRTFASDPRDAGAVLERRLRERGIHNVSRQAFVQEAERVEDPGDLRDAVVRRDVVRRLAEAIANAFAMRRPTHVYNALTGGIPEVNAVIDELVRLHAVASNHGCKVTSLKVPDGPKDEQGDRAVEEQFHPDAGIRARLHALSLIQKGNLLAAWGAVSHLENEPGQEWTKVVRWLADFASSMPIGQDCELPVLSHQRMAVRAALRVEIALRAGDIPRAVHGTVAFLEAALWDWLRAHIVAELRDGKGRPIVRMRTEPPPALTKAADGGNPFQPAPAPAGSSDKWFYIVDSDKGIKKLAEEYLQRPELIALCDAIETVRWLRNDVAHNEPTPELMKEARIRMAQAKLWSSDGHFLGHPLIQDVLRELGEDRPEALYTELIASVRSWLLDTSGATRSEG